MMNIHIGTSGWSYKDWVGNFYPKNTGPRDYLSIYSRQFNTVEIDSTFYGVPNKKTVENWYQTMPGDFKFSPKFPQDITHKSGLTGVDELVTKFLNTVSSLNEKLGPLLLQFPYYFKPEMSDDLGRFLLSLPRGFDYAIEVRNRKWLKERFFDMLRERSVGLVLADHPWTPKLELATSKTLYIRFLGKRDKIASDFSHERFDRKTELLEWKKIVSALEEKVDDFYGYFNNHYSGHSPSTASRFLKILEESRIKSGKSSV